MITWSKLRSVAAEVTTDQDTLEEIRRATADIRHQWRTQAAWEAALKWHGGDGGRARALCFLEAQGLFGGSASCPGLATTRHPAFRVLGKGRRQATDGPAWTAAIAAVGQGCCWAARDGRIGVVTQDGQFIHVEDALLSRAEVEPGPDDVWFIPESTEVEDRPVEAYMTAALHALRHYYRLENSDGIKAAVGEYLRAKTLAREAAV